jgi:hypothetical protein
MNDPIRLASTTSAPAPADARRLAAWPIWKRLLAYATLAFLAAAAIWFIDLRAHRPPALWPPPPPPPVTSTAADAVAAR